jgi:DNA-binding response OmpR family regulator
MPQPALSIATLPNEPAAPRVRPRPQSALNVWSIEILLVEDDAADASLILDVLKRHPNVKRAVGADAPDQALFDLASGRLRPNLILLDILMPKLNGFRFLEGLRGIAEMQDVPVVMLTTSRLAKDVERARDAAVCGYIVKPDSYDELRARLDRVIKQAITGAWSR